MCISKSNKAIDTMYCTCFWAVEQVKQYHECLQNGGNQGGAVGKKSKGNGILTQDYRAMLGSWVVDMQC